MAKLKHEEEELLKEVAEFFGSLNVDYVSPRLMNMIIRYNHWLITSIDYSNEQRKRAADKVKTMRKTDPTYSRESKEKQKVYQKRYREKKKKEAIENVVCS